MEPDLKTRLQTYAAAPELPIPSNSSLYADALASSAAAAAWETAGIICSHTRVLREEFDGLDTAKPQLEGDAQEAEGDAQVVTAPAESKNPAPRLLTFPPGENSLEKIALGAAGIPLVKNQNA